MQNHCLHAPRAVRLCRDQLKAYCRSTKSIPVWPNVILTWAPAFPLCVNDFVRLCKLTDVKFVLSFNGLLWSFHLERWNAPRRAVSSFIFSYQSGFSRFVQRALSIFRLSTHEEIRFAARLAAVFSYCFVKENLWKSKTQLVCLSSICVSRRLLNVMHSFLL